MGHGPSSPLRETKVGNGSEDDIRRESEFLFRCYSDPFSYGTRRSVFRGVD